MRLNVSICTPTAVATTAESAASTAEVVAVGDGDTIDVAASEGTADELLYGQEVQLVTDPSQADVDKVRSPPPARPHRRAQCIRTSDRRRRGYEYTYDAPYINQEANQAAERAAISATAGLWATCKP
jgi:endonuclease YncB( thermonuclease family)